MKHLALVGVVGALAFSLAPKLVSGEAWKAKELKILPKNIGKDEIKKIMKKQADALGVDCDHCHDVPDMAKNTEHKAVARSMMKMVREVNKRYFDGKAKVECMTCHRGKKEPAL